LSHRGRCPLVVLAVKDSSRRDGAVVVLELPNEGVGRLVKHARLEELAITSDGCLDDSR